MKRLSVLSRSYCHLCDDMITALQESQGRFVGGFVFDVIDIDQHPALETKWGDKVPVLLDGEVEICHYFLDPDRLTMHLSHSPIRA